MFGKEVQVIKRAVLVVTAVFITLNIYAVSFSVNNSIWKEFNNTELQSLSYPIPFLGTVMTGISLDELFPAVYEAWTLSLGSDNPDSRIKLVDPDLGDNMSKHYLVSTDGSWSVLYKNRLYTNIKSVNLDCETLEYSPLEIWVNWEGISLLRDEIGRYGELHSIDIKIVEVSKPDSKLISTTQANGSVPDVIMVQSSYIDRLARSGSIQNLDFMATEGFFKQGMDAFSLDKKLWGIPFYYDAQMIFYNPELVPRPDNNWRLSDFERSCENVKQNGKIPSAWNSYSASFLIPFQFAFGKKNLVESDGSILIDDKPTLDALEYILELQNNKLMQPMERDAMTSLFVSGETAMIISASYSIPHFTQLGIPFETAPLPVNDKTGIRVSPLLDFKAFAISKRSHNTTGARRLIEYLTGIGVQQRFTSETAKLPALEKAWLTAEETNPFYETLSISASDGVIIPTDKAYSVYKNIMWKMLRFAISGKLPADQVLKQTQTLVDKNMEERDF